MQTERKYKSWFRFIDRNRTYDYKSLSNAIRWAEIRVATSTSGQIRIYRVRKLSRGNELDCIAFTQLQPAHHGILNEESEKTPEDPCTCRLDCECWSDNQEWFKPHNSVLTVWRDINVFQEYKEKENRKFSEPEEDGKSRNFDYDF